LASALVAVAIGLLAAVPGVAAAKAKYRTGTYSGKTSQHHVITVGADGRHVRGLDSVVFAFCLFPGDARHELHRVRPTKPISIRNARFSSSSVGLVDGGSATIKGTLSGSKASGSVSVSYTELELQGARQVLGACRGQMTWSAKWKKRSYPPNPPAPKPPAKRSAQFSGQNADGAAVSFQTSADGQTVSNIDATYSYSCISGATGTLHLTSGADGGPINAANGFFDYIKDVPVAGVTDAAHFKFSGNIASGGASATGTMQVSFITTGGDSCVGDNATWSAHA
jgi:hypothetical protein